MKTTTVVAVEKFPPRHPAPCRHCGYVYNLHQRADSEREYGCCGGATGPLVRCPSCGCPADEPLNPTETA